MIPSDDAARMRFPGGARLVPATVALAAAALVAVPAVPQTASQITPPSFEPPLQRLGGTITFSGEPGLAAPAGADRLSVTIADVAVEGTLPGMEAETQRLEQRLTGGPVPVSAIFEAASALEEAYVNQGFVLARVVLPAQSLNDGGTLRLVVVDGFVESVDTTAVPQRVQGRLEQLTRSLVGRRGIRQSDLERQILLAGDTFGVALESALATGTEPGGTVIILKPQYRRVTGFVGFDNTHSDELGTWSIDAGVELNGLLGYGEAFYARASGYPGDPLGDDGFFGDSPRYRTLAAGVVLPLNADGLSLNFEVTRSDTAQDDAGIPTASTFERASVRLSYPIRRTRAFNLTAQLGLDLQSDQQDIVSAAGDLPLYDDRTTVLRTALDASWFRPDGSSFGAGTTFSTGLDAFGARSAADAAGGTPLSRAGADARFQKLEVYADYKRPLGEAFALSLHARGQLSFGDPLVTAEQFGIATVGELSAFDEGTIDGDSGWVVRGEISRPTEVAWSGRPLGLRPYVFAGVGAVHREQPEPGEAGNLNAHAYGIGIEAIHVRDPAYSTASVRLELGRGERDDGGDDGTRASLVGSFRF